MALEFAALHAALGLVSQPSLVSQARRSALPPGVTLLLQLAANDTDALERSAVATNLPPDMLRRAAEFFLEQVLFEASCNSYRVLGTDASATPDVLRRNMALLMRWLHPDIHEAARPGRAKLDRSVFAERVTAAWDSLKTGERREAYNRLLAVEGIGQKSHAGSLKLSKPAMVKRRRKMKVVPKSQASWMLRLLRSLKGGRRC